MQSGTCHQPTHLPVGYDFFEVIGEKFTSNVHSTTDHKPAQTIMINRVSYQRGGDFNLRCTPFFHFIEELMGI